VVRAGGTVVAYACLVDRSAGKAELDRPLHALLTVEVRTYPPTSCPLCQAGGTPVKPGSRTPETKSPSRARQEEP
jgi:orotate phosphoribosyltransferase